MGRNAGSGLPLAKCNHRGSARSQMQIILESGKQRELKQHEIYIFECTTVNTLNYDGGKPGKERA